MTSEGTSGSKTEIRSQIFVTTFLLSDIEMDKRGRRGSLFFEWTLVTQVDPSLLAICMQSNLPLHRALSSKALWTQIPLVAAVVISSQVTSCDRFSCAFQSKSNTLE